jgi:hypothetical protein
MKYRAQGPDSPVFNYWSYPFLISDVHKLELLHYEYKHQQIMEVSILELFLLLQL